MTTAETTKINYRKRLATGSRFASVVMLTAARLWARRCIRDKNTLVIVGDADGIDAAIIDEFNQAKCKRIHVYGWGGKVRNKTLYGVNVPLDMGPLQRNEHMILDRKPQDVTAFWNGKSNGTRKTFQFAQKQGITTNVHDFSRG